MDKNTNQPPIVRAQPVDITVLAGWMDEIRQSVGAVALLHERHTQNEKRLAESEERTAGALERIEHQIVRVHERMDSISQTVSKEVSSVRDEVRQFAERHRAETSEQIKEATAPIWKKVDENAASIETTRSELSGWINRAKGGWFIGSIFAGFVQMCIIGVLVWAANEIKTMHDWRIMQEAQQAVEKRVRN